MYILRHSHSAIRMGDTNVNTRNNKTNALILTINADLGHVCAENYQGMKFDELIVFADAQALPLFVLKLA